jgi:hypothetical protein
MIVVNTVWEQTTRREKEAWHKVTCQNSRDPGDVRLAGAIVERIKAETAALEAQMKNPH